MQTTGIPQGIIIVQNPYLVDPIDWAIEHPGCDALTKTDDPNNKMTILAYASDPQFNKYLTQVKSNDKSTMIFRNISDGGVGFIG